MPAEETRKTRLLFVLAVLAVVAVPTQAMPGHARDYPVDSQELKGILLDRQSADEVTRTAAQVRVSAMTREGHAYMLNALVDLLRNSFHDWVRISAARAIRRAPG